MSTDQQHNQTNECLCLHIPGVVPPECLVWVWPMGSGARATDRDSLSPEHLKPPGTQSEGRAHIPQALVRGLPASDKPQQWHMSVGLCETKTQGGGTQRICPTQMHSGQSTTLELVWQTGRGHRLLSFSLMVHPGISTRHATSTQSWWFSSPPPPPGSIRMAIHRRRGGFSPSGPLPPDQSDVRGKFTIGTMFSGLFWYTNFCPRPPPPLR